MLKPKHKLTKSELDSLITLNPDLGTFEWKKRTIDQVASRNNSALAMWNKKFAGMPAGTISSRGYLVIEINATPFKAHRLMWLHCHGFMPEDCIDHIDGNKLNNKISNLRTVSHTGNMRNAAIQKNNTSGFSGVYYKASNGLWVATIGVGGKTKQIGSSKCKDKAIAMRLKAESEIGYHENHGRPPCV